MALFVLFHHVEKMANFVKFLESEADGLLWHFFHGFDDPGKDFLHEIGHYWNPDGATATHHDVEDVAELARTKDDFSFGLTLDLKARADFLDRVVLHLALLEEGQVSHHCEHHQVLHETAFGKRFLQNTRDLELNK